VLGVRMFGQGRFAPMKRRAREEERAVKKNTGQASRDLWAYAYLIVLPQPKGLIAALKVMVEQENIDAELVPRIWTGTFVLESRITHILIVSDSPGQNRGINQKIENELKRVEAEFFITEPMTIPGHPDVVGEPHAPDGNGHNASLLPPKQHE